MFCCAGLFIGLYIGLYIGGIWTFIAPGIGFFLGIPFDMIFMRKMHHHSSKQDKVIILENKNQIQRS